jgi:hypothetical protein
MKPTRVEQGKLVRVEIYATDSGIVARYFCNAGHEHDNRQDAAKCSREAK